MSEGVTIYDPDRASQGYTLFCETFSQPPGRGERNGPVRLIDMAGRVVHEWFAGHSLQSYCRLLPDGNLIYPTHDRSEVERCTGGLFEITPQSEVVWEYRCRTDHDFQVLEGGGLLINQITESMCPALGRELKRHPYIVEITRDKELVWEWRGEEHLDELEALLGPDRWAHVMDRATGEFACDWAHNNTLQIIPPNTTYEKSGDDRFTPGNVLVSYRSCDVIAVVERPSGRMVWAWGPGILDGQHKPHMLPSGNVLIFDNGTLRKWSRVIELDPLTGRIEWEYAAEPRASFYSAYISSAERLGNGNTLICDGMNARLFEVTAGGEVVWEFRNPRHDPRASRIIYRCQRYSAEYVEPLLKRIV